jgi:hypothetical protein
LKYGPGFFNSRVRPAVPASSRWEALARNHQPPEVNYWAVLTFGKIKQEVHSQVYPAGEIDVCENLDIVREPTLEPLQRSGRRPHQDNETMMIRRARFGVTSSVSYCLAEARTPAGSSPAPVRSCEVVTLHRERGSVCVCVCVRERERERVCMCEREREREREACRSANPRSKLSSASALVLV